MKRRNKKYRPRAVLLNSFENAIVGRSLIPESMRQELLEPVKEAADKLQFERIDKDDWNILAQASNIAEALAGLNIGPNLLPQIKAMQNALQAIGQRMIERNTSTARASELADIREGIEMYSAQLKVCTQAELSKAVRKVNDILRSGGMLLIRDTYGKIACAENVE